jgi:UDP-N-acetylglucosamine--N-acetylmuramyl-(pentapeptide) pyrophosphoryl-undecaprenol N-acetylglucosamine transferase
MNKGAAVEFVGSSSGIEADLVPQAGYRLHSLPLRNLAGNPLARLRAGVLLLRAIFRCRRLIRQFSPTAVLGVGGYASAPAVLAARSLRIPTFLHEQNSVPGMVNRFSSRFTNEVMMTFPADQDKLKKASWVGMPTRPQFFSISKSEALERLGLEPPVVLIFGGSGGALKINLAAAGAFRGETPYTVVQIAGRRDYPELSTDNPRHLIIEYADEIWDYLAASDVVVIRSGAGSLFDTAATGKAAILIPYPYAAGDHQLHNARYFTDKDSAEMLLDSEVTPEMLKYRVEALLNSEDRRHQLAGNMHELATPEAADLVAERLLSTTATKKEH